MRRRTFLYGGAAASVALPGWAQAQASQVSPGIDLASKTVTVGAFTPITGPVPFYSILTHAADACFKWASDSNALNGWKINFVTYDDGYEPARSVAVTRRLVEENKIFALTAATGTAQSVAVIPYAKEVGLPMIGPIGGASALFSERLVFPLLPDYGWSAAANLDYAWSGLNAGRVALLWENDELGRSAKRGFDLYMEARKKQPAESIPFEVRSTDFRRSRSRGTSTGVTASTRRWKFRGIQSAEPMYSSSSPPLPNCQMRECSRKRPITLVTRMRELTPGNPGRRQQMPRTMRSISTPASDARYSASMISASTSAFILPTIRALRPA